MANRPVDLEFAVDKILRLEDKLRVSLALLEKFVKFKIVDLILRC